MAVSGLNGFGTADTTLNPSCTGPLLVTRPTPTGTTVGLFATFEDIVMSHAGEPYSTGVTHTIMVVDSCIESTRSVAEISIEKGAALRMGVLAVDTIESKVHGLRGD